MAWQPTLEPTGFRYGNSIIGSKKCLVASMWRPRRGILIAPCGSQRLMLHSCTLDAQPWSDNMHVHWNYAVSNHCAQLAKHAIHDYCRPYEVGRWAPATGPRTMLIAQSTERIFSPRRRLHNTGAGKNRHGHRHVLLLYKGATGLSRLLHDITEKNCTAMANLF